MTITITIIIPAYNESQRISRTLFEIDAYITKTSSQNQIKVITVDDGSIDNTENVVKNWIKDRCINKQCFETISYLPNHGKGYAVREGFLKAESDVVLYTDADGACSINELEKLMLWLDRGFDITCGSRILKDDISEVKMSFKRRLSGLVFHSILKVFGLASLKDTQCGFKAFKKEVYKKLANMQKCFNYSFDIEYLFLAKKWGYKIKELPINWHNVEGSKVNLFKDSIKMLLEHLALVLPASGR